MTMAPPGIKLRVHQAEALAVLSGAWTAGRTRAWVALPPGAGKTLVGLMTVQDRMAAGAVGRAVVLGPNTAIQGQWASQAAALGIEVGTDRSLEHQLTALTFRDAEEDFQRITGSIKDEIAGSLRVAGSVLDTASLTIDPDSLPDCLEVTATADDGDIMGVRHKTLPVFGVQYHPESVLSEHGHAMLRNFLQYRA